MRNITVLFCALCFTILGYSQEILIHKKQKQISVKFRLNYVDSSGEYSPFSGVSSFKENAFSDPLKLGIDYRLNELFSVGLDAGFNKWKESSAVIDKKNILGDQNYFSLDAGMSIYIDEAFNWFLNADWLDVYLNGGVGYFKVTEGAFSGNFGGGVNTWLSKKIALNFELLSKFSLDSSPARYESNHFQVSAGLVFRLSRKDSDDDGVIDSVDKCPKLFGIKANKGCPEDYHSKNAQRVKVNLDDTLQQKRGVIFDEQVLKDIHIELKESRQELGKLNKKLGKSILKDSLLGASTIETSLKNESLYSEYSDYLLAISRKISFKKGNYNFSQDSYHNMKSLLNFILKFPKTRFRIEGHTDSVGEFQQNRVLSKMRANSVRNYLIEGGVNPDNIITLGYGELYPIASNLTVEGQKKNRRVDILFID
ncbi:OmpA family protein [Thalassobellus citreus]|uniref:OmpA family protein n=1 Tax=Thalassobellus citreus TaxID=3367752 RepID=UPI0037897D86